jgi:hypothetical protein
MEVYQSVEMTSLNLNYPLPNHQHHHHHHHQQQQPHTHHQKHQPHQNHPEQTYKRQIHDPSYGTVAPIGGEANSQYGDSGSEYSLHRDYDAASSFLTNAPGPLTEPIPNEMSSSRHSSVSMSSGQNVPPSGQNATIDQISGSASSTDHISQGHHLQHHHQHHHHHRRDADANELFDFPSQQELSLIPDDDTDITDFLGLLSQTQFDT